MINLHEPHAAFHQPPRQQATAAKWLRVFVAEAIQLLRDLGFLGEIHRLGRGRLHAVGKLIGADAGLKFTLALARFEVLFIETAQHLKLAQAHPGRDALGQVEMLNGRSARIEFCPLIRCGHEAGAPVTRAVGDRGGGVGHDHERR